MIAWPFRPIRRKGGPFRIDLLRRRRIRNTVIRLSDDTVNPIPVAAHPIQESAAKGRCCGEIIGKRSMAVLITKTIRRLVVSGALLAGIAASVLTTPAPIDVAQAA